MERRLNYNKEIDDLTKINEFFQNAEAPTEYTTNETQDSQQIHPDQAKSAL